ncbi:serine hydrolase [Candidatus Woesearchaeota archaeon]|nr:serine hydrolase [Candidatus Woesearchaeota archaeon]
MPAFGFGLFFGFEISSFDSGVLGGILRRRHIESIEKPHDNEPSAEAPLSSGLSLDDKIMPPGIGALEKAAFFGSTPSADSSPYLFFLQAAHFYAANPRYIVYKPLDIPSGHYALGYFAGDFEDYSAEEQAEYAEQQRSMPLMPGQQPIVPAYLWSQSYRPAQSAQKSNYKSLQMPKYETRPETASSYQQTAETKIKVQNAFSGQIIPASGQKTIEFIVAKAEVQILQSPKIQIYAAQPLPVQFQILPKPSSEQYKGLRLDSRVQLYSAPKPLYSGAKPYQAAEKPQSTHGNGKLLRINYGNKNPFGYARNYDMDPRWINILSSGLWKKSLVALNAKQENGKDYDKGNPAYRKSAIARIKDKTRPAAEKQDEIKDNKYKDDSKKNGKEDQPMQEYQAEKDNAPAKTEETNPAYQKNVDDKKPKRNSGLRKIGYIAAGIGLMGLLGLSSALQPAKSEGSESDFYKPSYEQKFLEPKTVDSVVAPAAKTEAVFSQQFKAELDSIVNEATQLGYGSVSMSIRKNSTNEYFGIDDKTRKPGPSANKVAIAFAAAYLAQNGLLNLENHVEIDKECTLERELERYSMFKERKLFSYDELRRLMLRESVNTAANLMLKFIGKGNVQEGERAVERVMEAVGLGDIKIAHYNVDGEYLKGVTTTENAERLQGYILQGKHLTSQYMAPIKEDLENERHLDFGRSILGAKAGTKITMFKTGAGLAFHFDDYSGAVLFNDSKQPLWTDEARDAMSLRKFELPMFSGTRKLFDKIFGTLRTYLVEPRYERKAT